MTSTFNTSPWRPKLFILLVVAAVLLFLSWEFKWPDWRSLDEFAFFNLNGLLENSPSHQKFWAIANHRAFDLASAILVGLLYLQWSFSDSRKYTAQRLGLFFFLLIFSLIVLEISKFVLDSYQRISPSLELKPAHRLSLLIPDIKAKDSSGNSFPGDHGMVLSLWTGYFFIYAGKTRGFLVLIIAILFTMPRVVSGAHWLTDIIIGGGTVALIGIACLGATPLRLLALKWFAGFGAKIEKLVMLPLKLLRIVK